ncbi:MAG TPA: hypothetical protein VFS08_13255 [Gemmatimonadaceae bacterium]|nr:hypothetical protein [Gemmatimonadaceae bacterium]
MDTTAPRPDADPSTVERRGHWRLAGAAEPLAIFARLRSLLPTASHIVTAGDRRTWAGAAAVLDETRGDTPRPALAQGEQLLHFSARALELLALAARADAPTPFCRELRVYGGDALLLRWTAPPAGELRLAGSVATSSVWVLAATARAAHGWHPERP